MNIILNCAFKGLTIHSVYTLFGCCLFLSTNVQTKGSWNTGHDTQQILSAKFYSTYRLVFYRNDVSERPTGKNSSTKCKRNTYGNFMYKIHYMFSQISIKRFSF